ncbi:hypothetical protein N7G274_006007 [Stereocaulon virgatum]|uniref:Uncharacterized protein n=1 Tax=Stereocaulon virgatum TaxID=373712 RepID=A0ABR4ACG0_9LECA
MILSKPSVPEYACERLSPCATQRPQYKSRYISSSSQRSHLNTGPHAKDRSLSSSTTAIRLPTGSESTRKPVPTLRYQQTSKVLPVSCLSPPDLRVKALKVVNAVKRSWTSHFPQRFQSPSVSGRANRHKFYSSVTQLPFHMQRSTSLPNLHPSYHPSDMAPPNVCQSALLPTSQKSTQRSKNQALGFRRDGENTWAQQNRTFGLRLEQLERENSELHDRLSHYEPHNKYHEHDYYQHSLRCVKAQLMAAQNENARIQNQNEALMAALKLKPRKIEDVVGNIKKAHSQQWVPVAIPHALLRASNASPQGPSQSAPQATAYHPPYQHSATSDQRKLAHHLSAQSQAPQYHVAQYSTAQQLPAQQRYPPTDYERYPSQPPQSFLARQSSSVRPSASYEPAPYPRASHPPAYYNDQHYPQTTFFQNQNPSAQYPSARNYTAHIPPAQYSRNLYPSLSTPQDQSAPGKEFPSTNGLPRSSPQDKRTPAKMVRNEDVQVERPSNGLAPNENVQAEQNSTEQVQVQDGHIQDAPPGQSLNQPVQAEGVSTKEVHDENVQAVHAPLEPLQVQEAPAEQNSNLNTQFEGGPTNPIQVDDVPAEIVDVGHSRESGSEGTASILGEVRACIEEQSTATKLKSRDWYDGIDPRTMITDDERHLQFGLPSSKKRTATDAFSSDAADDSVASCATKVAKTPKKKSTKKPKPVLDEAGKAEIARQRKEKQKAYRKKHAEKKKAEKLTQQHERSSSIPTMSSQSQSNVEYNKISSEEEASRSSAMQDGEEEASVSIQTWEGMDSLEVLEDMENGSSSIASGAAIPGNTYTDDLIIVDPDEDEDKDKEEEVDDSDAALASELDKAIKDMTAADKVAPTHQPTAATTDLYESSESEESEEE